MTKDILSGISLISLLVGYLNHKLAVVDLSLWSTCLASLLIQLALYCMFLLFIYPRLLHPLRHVPKAKVLPEQAIYSLYHG
jgi:hypothetical protein